jgi:hypothetical protein
MDGMWLHQACPGMCVSAGCQVHAAVTHGNLPMAQVSLSGVRTGVRTALAYWPPGLRTFCVLRIAYCVLRIEHPWMQPWQSHQHADAMGRINMHHALVLAC